jgi:type II secretory pathway component HofQ
MQSAHIDQAAPSSPSRFDTRRIGAEAEGEGPSRFRGASVDLDLKNADLANVFRLLADVGHVNIVVSGEVTGTITLRLKHVPWDQALELIVRTRNLALERDGNVILVRPADARSHVGFAGAHPRSDR